MNPYESPGCEPSNGPARANADLVEPLVPDDSLRRLLLLAIGAASTCMLLLACFMVSCGLMAVAASYQGQGRFEGRTLVTMLFASALFVFSLFFAVLGALGLRTSAKHYRSAMTK